MAESTYIHGVEPEEQARLTLMQSILNDTELAALDLAGVRSMLDLGAGLGQMTRALARAAPGARVVGVERDARQLAEARRQAAADGEGELVELRAGPAEHPPLRDGERGSFDLVHARFLLEHVPDPLAVVRAMRDAARPGGRLVLVDDDHELLRLWPAQPTVERAWEVYWQSYARIGCDPLVGRRFTELFVAAGVEPLRVTTLFYGACRGMPRFAPVIDNLAGVLAGAGPALERAGDLPRGGMQAALDSLANWRAHPAAALWYSLPLAEGRRP